MKPIFDIFSIFIRAFQIVCAFINLGLDMAVTDVLLDATNYGDWWIYFLVVFLLTIIYLVVVLLPIFLRRLCPVAILVTETIYMVLWLVYFVAMTVAFRSGTCPDKSYYNTYKWCSLGKPVIAFGIISWLTFCTSLVLLFVFTIVPRLRARGMKGLIATTSFKIGAICLQKPLTTLPHDV